MLASPSTINSEGMCELNLLKELLDKRTATKLILFVHESLVNIICLLDVIGLSLYKYFFS